MRDRQTTLLWMKDLLEHLAHCHEQLQWADGGAPEAQTQEPETGAPSELDDAGSGDGAIEDATLGAPTNVDGNAEDGGPPVSDDDAGM